LTLGVGGGWLVTGSADATAAAPAGAPTSLNTGGTFATLAEKVKPAVININIENKGGTGRTPAEEFLGEEYFKRFFGDVPERLPRRSLGSGVIIEASGVALTNAHVVDKADKIDVVTLDGTKYTASVVGIDKKTDLAVLKLNGGTSKFPFVPLGNSDETQVGEWVLAVGSPFGLQATVTAGIISAKARQIGAGPYDDFLQTDAAINPGNSGGPLINMRGEVIGINTAIVRGGSGIGFAVPSNLARKISGDLVATGRVSRGWLGVSLQTLTSDLANSFGVKERKGALVAGVVPESPAAKAGLQPGDIVLEFAGRKVENPGDLARAVGLASPGTDAKVTVWRDKSQKTLGIKLAQAPADAGERPRVGQAGHGERSRLGVEVRAVTEEVAREMSLRSTDGVLVTGVASDSPAAAAGLRRGDVIVEVDRQPVKNLSDFERLTRSAKSDTRLTLRVQRDGGALYVAVPMGKS
jgi:serine protease Do